MKFLVALIAGCLIGQPGFSESFSQRAGGPTKSEMMVRTVKDTPGGMAFYRPVLSGVLERLRV